MKNLILLALLIIHGNALFAQNSYGTLQYSHPNVNCNSGFLGLNSPGFVLSGGSGPVAPGAINFVVVRTDVNGFFSGSTQEFQEEYQIWGDASCSSTGGQILTCRGVKVIEMSTGGYVAVGITPIGVFYVNLSASGAVANQGIILVSPHGPVFVTESNQTPGDFFMSFASSGIIHVYSFDQTGATVGSRIVDATGSPSFLSLHVHNIIHSPYTPNNLIIVGTALDPSNNSSGFFCEVDNSLSTSSSPLTLYDLGSASFDHFESIKVANSSAGGVGFLIGGESNGSTSVSGTSWILKVDPTGTVIWNTIIEGTLDATSRVINAVTERYSSFYARYECYAAAVTTVGIVVYKFDDNGVPMSFVNSLADEFPVLPGNGSIASDISYLNPGTGYDEGLHVYGSTGQFNGDIYLSSLYFSGETGCNTPNFVNNYDQPTVSVSTYSPPATSGISQCVTFLVTNISASSFAATCGPFTSVVGGDNNRMSITAIHEENKDNLAVYPNPSNGLFSLSGDNVYDLKITDVLGKIVFVQTSANENLKSVQLDLSKEQNGIYLLTYKHENKIFTQKLVVAKFE